MKPSALLALVLLATSPAAARDIAVEVEGCPALAPTLTTALRLEVPSRWRVVADAGVRLRVEVTSCDAPRWVLRVVGADGDDLHGPEPVAMAPFGEASRARIAALWAAERLPVDGVSRELDAPTVARVFGRAEIPPPGEDPFEPSSLPLAGGLVLSAGLGGAGIEDPAKLSPGAPLARVGLGVPVHELVQLGGALEGGALFEPYDHNQPFLRLCAEPQLTLPLGDLFELAVGPRACLSFSRHIRGTQDEWTGGVALGGLLYVGARVIDGLSIGLRFDADAWERDALAETSPARFGGAVASDLPWLGMFAGSVELRLR